MAMPPTENVSAAAVGVEWSWMKMALEAET
jgi:hypothetical protein